MSKILVKVVNMFRSIVTSAFVSITALVPFALAVGTPLGFGSGELFQALCKLCELT